jgi:glyoxylase-like metal-dependent hydrolase (beta-lactamase superfamily II)
MTTLSRRLLGTTLMAAPLLAGAPARASGPAAAPPPIIRRRVGRFEVSFLLDGHIDLPYGVWTGIAPDILEAAARRLHVARPSGVRSAFTQWLIRDGRHTLLVDAGPAGTVSPTSGRLPQALAALGVRPEQVEAVIATHLHVDHIGGLVAGGRLVFPNAEIFADRRDVAHFTDPAKAAAAPALLTSSFQAASELVRLYPRLQRLRSRQQAVVFRRHPRLRRRPLEVQTTDGAGAPRIRVVILNEADINACGFSLPLRECFRKPSTAVVKLIKFAQNQPSAAKFGQVLVERNDSHGDLSGCAAELDFSYI